MFFSQELHDEWMIITATYITLPNRANLLSWNDQCYTKDEFATFFQTQKIDISGEQ